MHRKNQLCTTVSWDPSELGSALDSKSPFPDELSSLNLAREEMPSFGQAFRTLLSEANEELATLLREVRARSDAALGGAPHRQVISDLLIRAVQCAVKQHRLQAELRNFALTDELTGLYNRRGFLCLTEQQLKLNRRSGHDMLLFFLDVDGLKQINDSFGHSEGDLALVRTAKAMANTFRDSDVLARLGGDEFAALTIDRSGHSETVIRARLRENLEAVNALESRYSLSLSLGIARFPPRPAASFTELLLEADRAMYQAKRNQRSSS